MAKLSEWVKTAQPGDKVVALKDWCRLRRGEIYTIEAIYSPISLDFGIAVKEVKAPNGLFGAYQALYFRPAPSIKVFTDLLIKEPVPCTPCSVS